MKNFKEIVFTNWTWMRALRFAIGLFIGIDAIYTMDALAAAISVVLLFQALANTCGVCSINRSIPS